MAELIRFPWIPLERRSSTLFLAGGAVLLVYAGSYGLETFADLSYPMGQSVLLSTGYLVGFLGLVGLYPAVADRAPKLSRAGSLLAAVSIGCWLVLLALGFGEVAGNLPPQSDVLPGGFFLVHPVAMILSYGVFAVALLRTDARSRIVGFLLLAPPALIVVLLAGSLVRPGDFPFGAFVISSGQGMAHLAIGYGLRTKTSASERGEESGEDTRELTADD